MLKCIVRYVRQICRSSRSVANLRELASKVIVAYFLLMECGSGLTLVVSALIQFVDPVDSSLLESRRRSFLKIEFSRKKLPFKFQSIFDQNVLPKKMFILYTKLK